MNAVRALAMAALAIAWGWDSIKNGEVRFRWGRPLNRVRNPVGYGIVVGAIALLLVFLIGIFGFSIYQALHPKPFPAPHPRTFAEQAADAYPAAALKKGVEGHAVLSCLTDASFHPRECTLKSEAPVGYGFGPAAMKIARIMTLSENDRPKVHAGERFDLPINFKIPPAQGK